MPDVFIQYWSMRIMAYLASLIALLALWGGWLLHRGRLDGSKWFLRLSMWAVVTPFLMNTAGWMLTENGRQPWIVQGLMKTANAELAVGHLDRHLDQPDRVRADLHRARRGRPGADAALRAQRARPRRGARRGAAGGSRRDPVPALTY